MRRGLCMLAALAVLAAVAMPAFSAERGGKAKKDRKETRKDRRGEGWFTAEPSAPRAATSFTDAMEKLKSQVGLTEKQEAKLQEMRQARDKVLERWDQTNQKKIEAMNARLEQAKNARARKAIEAQLKALQRARQTLAAGHEKRMFAILTPPQKGKWNGPILLGEVSSEFQRLNLSDAQQEKIKTLCEAQGKLQGAPVTAETHRSLINSLKKQVYQRILTADQRKEYARMKAPVRKRPDERTKRGKESTRRKKREE